MWVKVCVVTSLTLGFAALGHQSCSNSEKAKSAISGNLYSSGGTPVRSGALTNHKDLQGRYETLQYLLKQESLKLSIEDLREAKLSDGESEIRIWLGFGLAYPRCFMLRNLNGREEAAFIGPRKVSFDARSVGNAQVLMPKIPLGPPRIGWPQFDQLLKQQGFGSPIQLTLDESYTADPDEEIIVVEAKSGASYSMVFFPVFTESVDGRKALAVCKMIEQQFAIRVGCGPENN